MLSTIATWFKQLKEEWHATTEAAAKKQLLEDAKVIIDGLLEGHPVGTSIANLLINGLEKTIHTA